MSSRPSDFKLTAPGKLRLYSTSELMKLPPPTWLVENHLPYGGVACVYGQPGKGKSFVAIDLALSVASGCPWLGLPTQKGSVVYIAAEGGFGLPQRIRAWCDVHQVNYRALNIAWLLESVLINDTSDDSMEKLIDRIREAELNPMLIIIDTLARCYVGEENGTMEMGAFVAGVDRIRNEFHSTVLVVHHTNAMGTKERGNTALRGAADTMLRVDQSPEGGISVTCDKQKEAAHFDTIELSLQIVPSCLSAVVVRSDQTNEHLIVDWLTVGPLKFSELKDRAQNSGKMSLATLKRRLRDLLQNGEITKENGIYTVS